MKWRAIKTWRFWTRNGVMKMKRTPKIIKQQTEEWLDVRPQDMSYYMGALKALEFAGYEWKRDADGKHTLFKY